MSFSIHAVRLAREIPSALIEGELKYAPGAVKAFIEAAVLRFNGDEVVEVTAHGHLATSDYSSTSSQDAVIGVKKYIEPSTNGVKK